MDQSLEEYFYAKDKRIHYSGDCYVADYTEKTNSRKGVEISVEPFRDIDYFHLKKANKANINYLGINFEKYPHFIKGIENCECMFHAISDTGRPWTMFLELKYCEDTNIDNYAFKAYSQMKGTMDKLTNMKLIDPSVRRIYFVYSVPEHEEQIPFGAFVRTQNDTLRTYEESGIHLLGNNTMLIATPSFLFEPRRQI